MTEVNINLNILRRRIYRLTRAVLEMMKYLQYSKLYFQWKLWYRKNNSKQFVKVSHLFFLYDFPLRIAAENMCSGKFFCYFVFCYLTIQKFEFGPNLSHALVQFCNFSMFIGNPLWSQRQQIRLVSFPKIGSVRHRAHPSSSVCLWRSLGLRREIHVLSACSTNG